MHDTNQNKDSYMAKVSELKKRLLPATSVLILTHDYPDPDCIASAYGMSYLLSFWGVKSSVISFGGFVGRAENRAMIRYLNIPTVPFVLTEVSDFDRIILVDCYPGKGNVSLPAEAKVDAVIDHHPNEPGCKVPFFCDIRSDIGATSTIITRYLQEQNCPILPNMATALFYGIKTDTGDMSREISKDDHECYKLLFDKMNHQIFSKIENPDRGLEFFKILHQATESAVYYDTLGYTHLGNVSSPDYIAEMADLFHSLEKLEWMICSGIFKNQIFFSIRSKKENRAGKNAELLAKTFNGSGGGHSRVAAGRIPLRGDDKAKALEIFVDTIEKIFEIQHADRKTLL
ncbi:phosphoesterase [Chitinispirillum alkaliphilum]|nr:phosphoesterase [Chitinispirillum alkaliphilum]